MAILNTAKAVLLGLTLAFAFSSFILSIIWTNHQIVYTTTGYSPAIIAFLVLGILHTLYQLWLLIGGRRHKIDSASTILAIEGMFLAWYFALAVFLTAKRYTTHYCPDDFNRVASTCYSFYKAILAVIWFDFGLLMIYMGLVAASAKKYGRFSTPDGDLLPEEELEFRDTREKHAH